MLKFDIKNLRSVYVYILKVTSNYVYVTTTRGGSPYKTNTSTQGEHNGHVVSKIRIHQSVSNAFSLAYISREFSRPWLASLNYYEDEIVSVELQRSNKYTSTGYQDPMAWQSSFSKVIPVLQKHLSNVNENEIFVNGTEIFWTKPDKETNYKDLRSHFYSRQEIPIDSAGFFTIKKVSFVRLNAMGIGRGSNKNTALKELKARDAFASELNKDDIKGLDNTAVLLYSKGNVLTYYPNAQSPNAEKIQVFSPVLQSAKFNSTHKNNKKSEEKKVYFLASATNRAYANVEFAIKAAHTIGRLYGYEHTDALNIQAIIEETGEVNLMNIDESSRKTMPIKMNAMTSIAYLFSFIYKEKSLSKLRDLSSMFRFCINSGLVYEKDISGDFMEGVTEIPLVSMKSEKEVLEMF